MGDRISYVGLDVRKDTIVVAVAEDEARGEVREYGRMANTPAALDRLVRKFGQDGARRRFCYEAGPCGYNIQRQLSARGHDCVVVAPSLIPKRAGDRVKTDRRDAASLATVVMTAALPALSGTTASQCLKESHGFICLLLEDPLHWICAMMLDARGDQHRSECRRP